MQNLQRESKTPYGNQRKITLPPSTQKLCQRRAQRLTAIRGKSHVPQRLLNQPRDVLNALRQSEENHKESARLDYTPIVVLNALRQSEENHTPIAFTQNSTPLRAQRLTAIRGKSPSILGQLYTCRSCSTPYGNQRKITALKGICTAPAYPVLNALRQSEENHNRSQLAFLQGWLCSTPYGNQRKITASPKAPMPATN